MTAALTATRQPRQSRRRWRLPTLAVSLVIALVGGLAVAVPAQAAAGINLTGNRTVGSTVTATITGIPESWSVLAYTWTIDTGTAQPEKFATTQSAVLPLNAAGRTVSVKITHCDGPTMCRVPTPSVSTSFVVPLVNASGGSVSITGPSLGTADTPHTATPVASSPALDDISYAWSAGGAVIPDAHGAEIRPTAEQLQAGLTVTARFSQEFYEPLTRVSDAVSFTPVPITPGGAEFTVTPQVGIATAVSPLGWIPMPTELSTHWTLDGVPVLPPRGIASTFTPTASEASRILGATVSGDAAPFYTTASAPLPGQSILSGQVSPGPVTLSGEQRVGSTLTAVVDDWGVPVAEDDLSYQWFTASPDAAIVGATSQAFTPTPDLLDKSLFVRVQAQPPGYSPDSASSDPVTVQGRQYNADGWVRTDGVFQPLRVVEARLDDWGPSVSTPNTVTWQWFVGTAAVPGATTARFTLPLDSKHKNVWAEATVSNPAEGFETKTVSSNSSTVEVPNPPEGTLVYSGNAYVGELLTVRVDAWTQSQIDFTVQWWFDGEVVHHGPSFTPTSSQQGAEILAIALADDPLYYSQPVHGTRLLVQAPTPMTVGTASLSIDDPQIDADATATLQNASEIEPDTARTWHWEARNSGGTFEPIAEATSQSLRVGPELAGTEIRAVLTLKKSGKSTTTLTSDPKEVQGFTFPDNASAALTERDGELRVEPAGWTATQPVFTMRWFVDGEVLAGEEGATLPISLALRGKSITVQVTANRTGFSPKTVTTNALRPALLSLGEPEVTLSANGELLEVEHSDWATEEGTPTIAWFRDGMLIPGANHSAYQVPQAHLGSTFFAAVTVSATGYETLTEQSNELVVPKRHFSSLGEAEVILSGSANVGTQAEAILDGWELPDRSVTWQWFTTDGTSKTALPGETDEVLTLTAALVGQQVLAVAEVSAPGYSSAPVDSAPLTVGEGELPTATVEVSGSPTVNETLTAAQTGWDPTVVTVAWQWFANGQPLNGENDDSLLLAPELVDTDITVRATGTRPGYTASPITSEALRVGPADFSGTGVIVLAGSFRVGETLRATLDGLSPAPSDVAWQWYRVEAPNTHTPIADATSERLLLTPDLLNAEVIAVATPSLLGYRPLDITTVAQQVGAGAASAGTPAITADSAALGTRVTSGQTLRVNAGSWTPASTQLSYEWFAGQESLGSGNTLLLTDAHVGKAVRAVVTGTAPGYGTGVLTVATTETPEVQQAPRVSFGSGPARAGAPLTIQGEYFEPGTVLTLTLNQAAQAAGMRAFTRLAPAAVGPQIGSPVRVTSQADGSFSARLPIPANAPTGAAVLTVDPLGAQFELTVLPAEAPNGGDGTPGGSGTPGSPGNPGDSGAPVPPAGAVSPEASGGAVVGSPLPGGAGSHVGGLAATGQADQHLPGVSALLAAALLAAGLLLTLRRRERRAAGSPLRHASRLG